MREIVIGGVKLGSDRPTFVIAEIGINHNGRMELVKQLIDAARAAGCQAVKFQKRTVPVVYSPEELAKAREVPAEMMYDAIRRGILSAEAIERLEKSGYRNTTNGDLKWALELTRDEYREIDRYCKEIGMMWFASCWDEASVDFFDEFDPVCYKVASASLTDDGLLRHIYSKGKPAILSTGMSTDSQIKEAIKVLAPAWKEPALVLLHCVSTYPAKLEELNLEVIRHLSLHHSGIPVGYSGHETGLYTTLCAVAMGACVIERHITLDRKMWGSDQAASLEPKDFAELVGRIREFEAARGDGVKRVLESEIPIMKKLRRKG